jgi:hypothetical protein
LTLSIFRLNFRNNERTSNSHHQQSSLLLLAAVTSRAAGIDPEELPSVEG